MSGTDEPRHAGAIIEDSDTDTEEVPATAAVSDTEEVPATTAVSDTEETPVTTDPLHQQKYYLAFCAFCASDAPDAGTQIGNQDATTLPHNAPDAT